MLTFLQQQVKACLPLGGRELPQVHGQMVCPLVTMLTPNTNMQNIPANNLEFWYTKNKTYKLLQNCFNSIYGKETTKYQHSRKFSKFLRLIHSGLISGKDQTLRKIVFFRSPGVRPVRALQWEFSPVFYGSLD